MELKTFYDNFELMAEAPNGVQKLRETILQLAVHGKLVPQDPNDEPASVLLERIQADKKYRILNGLIRNPKPLPPIDLRQEPFMLPQRWVWSRFGDCTICRDGERIPLSKSDRQMRQGRYDYYGASGVIDQIDDYLFDRPLLLIGEDGANLLSRSTPIAFIARGKYWVNNHAHVLDGINEDFLRYLELYINATNLEPYITGTAQPKMNQAKMNSIFIALPPDEEQKRIVAKVDELMALCYELEAKKQKAHQSCIQLNTASIDKVLTARTPKHFNKHWQRICDNFDLLYSKSDNVSALRQAILELAVRGKLVPQDPNDEPAESVVTKIYAEKIRLAKAQIIKKPDPVSHIEPIEYPFDVPEGWGWYKLLDIVTAIQIGPFGSLLHKSDYITGGIPLINPMHIKGGRICPSKDLTVDSAAIKRLHRYVLNTNDVIMGRRGEMGRCAVVTELENGFLCGTGSVFFRKTDFVFSSYLALLLSTEYSKRYLMRDSVGTTMNNLNQKVLGNLMVPLPPREEQHRVVDAARRTSLMFKELEDRLETLQSKNRRLMEATVAEVLAA